MLWFVPLAAAAVSAASSVASTLLNNSNKLSAEERQYGYQKQLNQQQQEYAQENMKLQNQLNEQSWFKQFGVQTMQNARLMASAPTANRNAMVSAGYSPMSEYGSYSPNVATPSGNTTSALSPSSGGSIDTGYSPFSFDKLLGSLADFIKLPSEIELNQALKNQAQSNSGKIDEEAETIKQSRESIISELNSRISKNYSEQALNSARSLAQSITNSRLPKMLDLELTNGWSDNAVKEFEAVSKEANLAVMAKNIEVMSATIDKIKADISLTSAQKAQAYALAYQARMLGMFTEKQAERYNEQLDAAINLNKSLSGMNAEQKNYFKALISLTAKQQDWVDINNFISNTTSVANSASNMVNSGANMIKSLKGTGN